MVFNTSEKYLQNKNRALNATFGNRYYILISERIVQLHLLLLKEF
tara:strand:- start:44532 stop:44666 length:135 start_codon:yes stop_codon:yes gene_type:complete